MRVLVIGNLALIVVLSFLSWKEASSVQTPLSPPPAPQVQLITASWLDLKERALPLVTGLMLLGMTYGAALRSWRQGQGG